MLLRYADFRARARVRLPRFVFDYVDSGAEDESCLARNERDLADCHLLPLCLRNTTKVNTTVEVFGQRWSGPVGIAPLGFSGLVRPDGDVLLAMAAAKAGVPFVLSTASNARLESVRAAVPSASIQWMQLYVMSDRGLAEQMVRRAKVAGYGALVLTVDVPVSGLRERDVRNGFKLPFRPSLRTLADLVTHPGWSLSMARQGSPSFVNLAEGDSQSSARLQAALLARAMDRSLVWDSLTWLRSLWDGPLLIKGVLNPADASLAVRHGVDGIVVSNHGGRQLDAAPSTISVLPRVLDATAGRIPVFVDSGFRRGSDVLKAIALGARAAFIGRPAMWGLAADGEQGVSSVLRLFLEEIARTMTLIGNTELADLKPRQVVHPV